MDNEQGAHVNVIYLPVRGRLYTVWRGLLFITNRWAVQSLKSVIAIVPTLSFLFTLRLGIRREIKDYMNIFYFRKLLFAAVLLLCGTVVNAHDFEVGGIYYNITDTTAKTVEVTYRGSYSTHYDDEYDDEVFIPVTVTYDSKTYSVTSIRNCAFEGCDYLKNVTIGNSVTSIGSSAFEGCDYLKNVTIGNSVTSIGSNAFEGCGALSSITIPNSVTTIGDFAFYECDRLYKVQISDLAAWCTIDFGGYYSNPLSYAGNLYLNERLVTRFVISSNITSISNFAFSNCQSITSVIIPNSVTSIGNCAFSDCI